MGTVRIFFLLPLTVTALSNWQSSLLMLNLQENLLGYWGNRLATPCSRGVHWAQRGMDFLSGMAEGIYFLAAEIVFDLRAKYPCIKLYCIFPIRG